MTGYGEDIGGIMLRFPARTREFYSLQSVQHGSVARPAFRVMSNGGALFGSKVATA
jgi:hypothetical protein